MCFGNQIRHVIPFSHTTQHHSFLKNLTPVIQYFSYSASRYTYKYQPLQLTYYQYNISERINHFFICYFTFLLNQENEQAKRNQIKQLHQVLESLGTFNFNKPNEAILKRNLAKMYHQIGKYCSRNKIDVTMKDSSNTITSSDSPDENILVAPPAPPPPPILIPPPPPPPPLTPLTSINATPQNDTKHLSRKRGALTARNISTTPCDQRNEELLKKIRGGCRSELRRTSFKRSPGGTPFKRQRRVSDSNASDLITVALKKKFQNVTFQSPRENDSPRSFTSFEDLQQN